MTRETRDELMKVCATEIDQPPYLPHSNVIITQMVAACKKCGKPNNNGYQYCTACHTKHKSDR